MSCSEEEKCDGDFVIVTVDGTTYYRKPENKISMPTYRELKYTMYSVWLEKDLGLDYELYYCEDLDQLAISKPGNYHVFWYYGQEMRNLDFKACLSDSESMWVSDEGKHVVTSIKRVGDKVQIEGTFDIIMPVQHCFGTGEDRQVSGKYRITVP